MNKGVTELNEIHHHGILGMKWGVRRFQNADGSLTEAGKRRVEKTDARWAHRNYEKIASKARKEVSEELNQYGQELLSDPSSRTSKGKISSSAINAYNRKMAELMNRSASEVTAPSGRVVQFVAKRGEVGVHMALADRGYDMGQLKNGVWASGRIAYRKKSVDTV